jgi:hypothetical protein
VFESHRGHEFFFSCTVFVLSGRGLCEGPIPRPEESYRLWCVSECDQVLIKTLDTCCKQVEEGRSTTTMTYAEICLYLLNTCYALFNYFFIKRSKLKSTIYGVSHYVIVVSFFYFVCLEARPSQELLSKTLDSPSRRTNTGLNTLCCPSKGLKNDKRKQRNN